MRHPIKVLIAAAHVPAASAQSLPGATTQVYFTNTSDVSGTVDVYVDGVKTATNIFNNTPSMFPTTIASGEHQIVITKAGVPLGQADVVSGTLNIPAGGTYTVDLENVTSASTMNTVQGFTLDLTQGNPDNE